MIVFTSILKYYTGFQQKYYLKICTATITMTQREVNLGDMANELLNKLLKLQLRLHIGVTNKLINVIW